MSLGDKLLHSLVMCAVIGGLFFGSAARLLASKGWPRIVLGIFLFAAGALAGVLVEGEYLSRVIINSSKPDLAMTVLYTGTLVGGVLGASSAKLTGLAGWPYAVLAIGFSIVGAVVGFLLSFMHSFSR